MREYNKFIIIFSLVLSLTVSLFSQERSKFVVESRLFQGTKTGEAQKVDVVVSSHSEPFLMFLNPGQIKVDQQSISILKSELNTVYQLDRVEHIVSHRILWDGKKKSLVETVSLEGKNYPISLFPRIKAGNRVNLKIEITQHKDTKDPSFTGLSDNNKTAVQEKRSSEEITLSEENLLLSTEIDLNIGDSVVLGFPSNGHIYFLSLNFRKRVSQSWDQFVYKGMTEINIFKPPDPVHKVMPIYPKECKSQEIEGAVILEVTTDELGKVVKLKTLKSPHSELEKAAREALKQWQYEPVKKGGKPISVFFAVTVDFKLEKKDLLG